MSKRAEKSIQAWRKGVGFFLLFLFAAIGLYAGIPALSNIRYEGAYPAAAIVASTTPEKPERVATHVKTPDSVRGIYMTSCVASSLSVRKNLVKLMDETEINSVVIDIKSFDGHISFMPKSPDLKFAAIGDCFVRDMQDFIDELHSHGIYVIGRIASFQDQLMVKLHPEIAVKKATATTTAWRDYKGIAWIDPSARSHWEYIASIAREAYDIGFDELNFDYIRFPADGNMSDIWYPLSRGAKKSDVMHSFYEYLHAALSSEGITISADLFGMTTTNADDLNIGQVLEYTLPNFDYVMPMVYPSHYPFNFMGLGDPNLHVYEVVKISMDQAIARAVATSTVQEFPSMRIGTSSPALYGKPSFDAKKLRPWLQDNNYPVAYTPAMVRAQIQAAYDSGLNSWALWNAGNRYTKAALEPMP